MKFTLRTVLFLFLLFPLSMTAADILDNIASAISSGNAVQLSKFFDSTVDITIVDRQSVYSKAQSQMVVQDFFNKNPVKHFSLIHRGSSAQGASYGIGNLESGAQSYRVYFYVKQKNGSYVIEDLRFDKQK